MYIYVNSFVKQADNSKMLIIELLNRKSHLNIYWANSRYHDNDQRVTPNSDSTTELAATYTTIFRFKQSFNLIKLKRSSLHCLRASFFKTMK